MKYLIAGTGGVGGSIAGFLVACRKRCNLYCPWSSFAVNTNQWSEIEIGSEG